MRWYEESVGAGSPVVFLPGSGWCANAGMNIADELKSDHQVRLVDLPGIGRSDGIQGRVTPKRMGEWVEEYLDERGIGRSHLIGHSLGGAILLAFSVQNPNRVKSLTLLDIGYARVPRFPIHMLGSAGYLAPVVSGLERAFGPKILQKVMGSELSQGEAQTVSKLQDDLDARIADVKSRGWYSLEDDEYLRKALEFEPSMSVEGMALWLALYRMNPRSLIPQITFPCMLMHGLFPNADVKFRRRVQQSIKKCYSLNPQVDYYPVPSGHYVHWSDADVVRDIGAFVRQHDETA
jgi:2-hydroxy-6-oxonona-2,4-dienedioate hydrolase